MEWQITPLRIGIAIALIVAFGLLGGFVPPEAVLGNQARLTKAWFALALLFCVGAAAATMGDQYVGLMDRTSLRKLYLVGGILMMLIALFFQYHLGSANSMTEEEEEGSVRRELRVA